MEYTAYSSEDVYMKTIVVSGGGMDCSGATHAEVQVIYKDKDMTEIKAVYYEEFGKNPLRKYIGDDIEWGEDDNFKVLNDGKYNDDKTDIEDSSTEED